MKEVTQLYTTPACADIARTLRSIADDVENGEYGYLETAALIIARSSRTNATDGHFHTRTEHTSFCFGPRHDDLSFLGAVALALQDPAGNLRGKNE